MRMSPAYEEIGALSRVLEAVSNACGLVPSAVIAQIDPDSGLWTTVTATLTDIKITIDKLNELLGEVDKSSSFFSRGSLRKPTKHIKFVLRLRCRIVQEEG